MRLVWLCVALCKIDSTLKFTGSCFEGLSLRDIQSLQKIILPIQEEILEIVEDSSYLSNGVKI